MSFTRLDQAIRDEDFDLVIELATKAKAAREKALQEEAVKKQEDALRNPAKVEMTVIGRNGFKLTHSYEIPRGQQATIQTASTLEREAQFRWGWEGGITAPPRYSLEFHLEVKTP